MPADVDITKILVALIERGLTIAAAIGVGIWIAFHNPEKVQKWMSIFWGIVVKVWRGAEKKFITNDIEGRVNSFVRRLACNVTGLEPSGIRIEWIIGGETPEQFFADKMLVVRMHQHRNQNKNFVNAAMVFVAKSVLPRAKRCMSPTQKKSIDLFVGKKLFDQEKPSVADQFYEDYLAPSVNSNKNIAHLIEKFSVMEGAGIFFPVFIQEMHFLGGKLFADTNPGAIIGEINKVIEFLTKYASREVGDEKTPTTFQGPYCRCGIVIVGKRMKREQKLVNGYVGYAKGLIRQRIENIYLLGPAVPENVAFIDDVAARLEAEGLERYLWLSFPNTVRVGGKKVNARTRLVLLRHPEAMRYFDQSYQKEFIEGATEVQFKSEAQET